MKYQLVFICLFTIAIILTGCSKDSSTEPVRLTDKEAIERQVIQADSIAEFSISEDATIDDQSESDWNKDGFAKITTPINPIRWGRHIESVSRTVNVVIIGDTAAIATVVKTISGKLIIAASYSGVALLPDTIIRKPFTLRSERRIRFIRTARSEQPERDWRPVAITLVKGDAVPDAVNKFVITSLEITAPHDTVTVTNPLETWLWFRPLRNRVPVFVNNDSVKVRLTVESSDTSKEIAVLRFGVAQRWHPRLRTRMELVSEIMPDTNTYIRTYQKTFPIRIPMGLGMGRFNAVVDVLSRGTLFDDSAPVSNRFWGLPYVAVRRER